MPFAELRLADGGSVLDEPLVHCGPAGRALVLAEIAEPQHRSLRRVLLEVWLPVLQPLVSVIQFSVLVWSALLEDPKEPMPVWRKFVLTAAVGPAGHFASHAGPVRSQAVWRPEAVFWPLPSASAGARQYLIDFFGP